jgi:hypothetical protein
MKTQNKRTLRERPVAGYATLPDICSSSLRLHVRCLAYPATGRLQFLGFKLSYPTMIAFVKKFLTLSNSRPSEQNNATIGCLSLPGLTGQSSRIVNFPLNSPMDHPVKPDDDLI